MSYDPYWLNVVLAMHMDDAGLTDIKGHAVALSGNASRAEDAAAFGGYSLALDGNGDYATVASSSDLVIGSSDFTISMFVTPSAQVVSYPSIIGNYVASWAANSWMIAYSRTGSTNKFQVFIYGYSSSSAVITSAAYPPGTRYHLELTRSGNTLYLFVNGNLAGTATYSGALSSASSDALYIGKSDGAYSYFAGKIDDLLITKGVARHTAAFSVPTEAFADSSAFILGVVTDSSGAPAARTVRAYRRSDGALLGSAISDASNGAFSIDTPDNSAYYVVCLSSSEAENALILDYIIPET